MRIAAAVLTYQALSTDRREMLVATVRSLAEADAVFVVDNGSTDGTRELVESWGGISHDGPLHTSGHGTNLCARVLAGSGADVLVLSDDDMAWHPGWRDRLERWWSAAPADLALTGCHLEPEFPWNAIGDLIECGGVRGLTRDSTGAASWSLRAEHYDAVFGPAGIWQQRQGYGDVMACDRVRDRGCRIAQIDLAEHAGHGLSTWGNKTVERWGWDIEPVRRRLEATCASA